MLNSTTQEFREIFLLEFTKELINSFAPKEIIQLKTIINEEEKGSKEEIKRQVKERFSEGKIRIFQPTKLIPQKILTPRKIFFQPKPLITNLMQNNLPERLRYLKPIPKEINMNLGKINSLLKDPQISSLECNGEGKNIIVNAPSPKTTEIILTKEEIEKILEEFSRVSKIPIEEGIVKIASGRFILLAAVSKIVPTRFIIKKIAIPQRLY